MESLFIKDFRRGLDTRRSELTQQPGTLEVLTNGFVNQGGEIENRKAFVRTAQIANSFGLQTTSSGLYTFGSATAPGGYPLNIGTVGVPIYVNYQQLKHPQDMFDGTTNVVPMTEVVCSTEFRGKAWVVAKFGSSGTFGYYDGTLVYDFTNGVVYSFLNTNAKIAQFIEQMIDRTSGYTAATVSNVVTVTGQPGQPFNSSAAETTAGNGTLTAVDTSAPTDPVDAKPGIGSFSIVAGSSAAGTNKITKVEVNGVTITNAAVDWTTSNEATATLLASSINTKVSTPDYTAEANGATVTIEGLLADGDASNGFVVKTTCAGDVCVGKAQFQLISNGTSFNITTCTVGGVDILAGTVAVGNTVTAAALIATQINGGTGGHGYLANATGSIVSVSKAVTASDDVYIPIYFAHSGTNGNGIFELGTTPPATMSAVIVVTLVKYYGTGYNAWRVFFTLVVSGGILPYSSAQWFGGTVNRIDDNHFWILVSGVGSGTPPEKVPIPAVYCKVYDATGVSFATSNKLV